MKPLFALTLFCAALTLRADTVFLIDGSEINGTITHQDGNTVVLQMPNGTSRSIRRSTIDTIVKEAPKLALKEPPKIPARGITPTPSAPVSAQTNSNSTPDKSPIAATGQAAPPPTTLSAPVGLGQPQKTGAPAPRSPSDIAKGAPEDAGTLPAETVKIIPPTPDAPSNIVVSEKITDSAPNPAAQNAVGVPPIDGFPDHTKRMSKRKESLFRDALEAVKGTDDALRDAAILDIQGLGPEVVPYCWAGVQNESGYVRIACMKIIGNLNGRNCTKRVIETFYATMPEASQAATWNVPFVRAIKSTVASITGQSFISVEPKSPGVQDGLKKYIEWYNANYERLPRQVGEPDIDPTDPDFSNKLADIRKLKLVKREWQRSGGLPADLVSGPNNTTPGREALVLPDAAEREVDKKYGASIPKVGRDELNKNDPQPVKDKLNVFKRDVDVKNEATGRDQVTQRDPQISGKKDAVKGEAPKAADALKRPQDLLREQQ